MRRGFGGKVAIECAIVYTTAQYSCDGLCCGLRLGVLSICSCLKLLRCGWCCRASRFVLHKGEELLRLQHMCISTWSGLQMLSSPSLLVLQL